MNEHKNKDKLLVQENNINKAILLNSYYINVLLLMSFHLEALNIIIKIFTIY